jgi:hypothetical protein
MILLIGPALLVSLMMGGSQTSAVLNPEMGVVLGGEQAGWLLEARCSRQVPGPVESAWLPDEVTIQRLERALGPALDDAIKRVPTLGGRAANDYYRQYAGAVIGGVRVVYISGFYRSFLEGGALRDEVNRLTHARQWRTTAIGVMWCDGGTAFFGAEYYPDSGEIRNIRFDGAATVVGLPIDSVGTKVPPR